MSSSALDAQRAQLARQVHHWTVAVDALDDLTRVAAPSGWRSLERCLGFAIETALRASVDRLRRAIRVLDAQLAAAETGADFAQLSGEVVQFRDRYLGVESVLDFYGDAIRSRTNEKLGAYLRACDLIAGKSMADVLCPLGKRPPPVLTYVDKGLGASILKAGLRLWDGRSESPVAAIKIVQHNLLRPTALLHETGHQVAHETGYNDALRALFRKAFPGDLGSVWASWASEVAADAFAFGCAGYAAVATLHDVLAGSPKHVMRFLPGDPHPIGYLRVLLGHRMCVRFFGKGPWDDLALAWLAAHRAEDAQPDAAEIFRLSIPALAEIVERIFFTKHRCFGQKALVEVLDPARVRPEALEALARTAGPSLFTSDTWLRSEQVRLLALSGWRIATAVHGSDAPFREQEAWMIRLGRLVAER